MFSPLKSLGVIQGFAFYIGIILSIGGIFALGYGYTKIYALKFKRTEI